MSKASYASYAGEIQEERVSAAATVILEMEILEKMMYSILENTSIIEEKLIGPVPEKEPGMTKTISSDGYFGILANRIQTLQDRARAIESKLTRVYREISI